MLIPYSHSESNGTRCHEVVLGEARQLVPCLGQAPQTHEEMSEHAPEDGAGRKAADQVGDLILDRFELAPKFGEGVPLKPVDGDGQLRLCAVAQGPLLGEHTSPPRQSGPQQSPAPP